MAGPVHGFEGHAGGAGEAGDRAEPAVLGGRDRLVDPGAVGGVADVASREVVRLQAPGRRQ